MVVRHLQGQGWLGEVEGAGGGQEVTVYLGGGGGDSWGCCQDQGTKPVVPSGDRSLHQ